ncbi:MAG: hypothetical protein ACXU8U_08490 [Asticcacaulis sp.]
MSVFRKVSWCAVAAIACAAPFAAVAASPVAAPPATAAVKASAPQSSVSQPSTRKIAARAGSRLEAAATRAAVAVVHDQAQAIAMAGQAGAGQKGASQTGDQNRTPIRPQPGTRLADAARSHDLTAYALQSGHAAVVPAALKAQVLAALSGAQRDTGPDAAASHGAYASGAATGATVPSAPQGSDSPAIVTGDVSLLTPDPQGRLAGMAEGFSTGRAMISPPDQAALSHSTALAIVKAFQAPPGTAEQAAIDAADNAPAADPAMDERLALARTVFKVDGTDQIIRHFVEAGMMRAIVTEVAKYIEITKLSDSDKYRLAAIVGAAQTELEEKVLNLGGRIEASWLTSADLKMLIAAYDNDAQRKLTEMRLHDNGDSDRRSMNDLQLARDLIIRDYDAK